jgi:hypothetical protein
VEGAPAAEMMVLKRDGHYITSMHHGKALDDV